MNRTKQAPHKILSNLVAIALLATGPAKADDYGDARAELHAAFQKGDYAAMQSAATKALAARPGFPAALFNLALSQSLGGDPEASLQTLNLLVQKGVDFGVAKMDEFASVRDLESWDVYQTRVEALYSSSGEVSIAVAIDESQFVPEGIAIDEAGDIYLGSIRTGALIRATGDRRKLSNASGHWSVFGMRFHPDGSLWFASAAVPQFTGVGAEVGKTGLFRLDTTSGKITQSAILAQRDNEAQVLGDLIIADQNTIYATDSLSGAVYRFRIDTNSFESVVERGGLVSPQGLVLDDSGKYLYVADYVGGLYRVSLDDGALVRLRVDSAVTDYGIDGLYRRGNRLFGIQNGITPNRLIALELSDDGVTVLAIRSVAANHEQFDEPTLGVLRADTFYFVANSHWNRFDQDNNLPDGLTGPVVLKIDIQ